MIFVDVNNFYFNGIVQNNITSNIEKSVKLVKLYVYLFRTLKSTYFQS